VTAGASAAQDLEAEPSVIEEPLQPDGQDAPMSWEEYRDAATREVGGVKMYVVEWDVLVTLDELRVHYDAYYSARTGVENKGTVKATGGNDVLLSDTVARDIDYCVSTDFGANHARAVFEVSRAAHYWASQANLKFRYVSGHNGSCNEGNANIDLPIVSHSGGGAWSFFPDGSGGCAGKTGHPEELCMDYNDFDNDPDDFFVVYAPNLVTTNVFIHEMGHFLGLVHEHNRASMPFNPFVNCPLDGTSNWRAVTPYDQNSTMHYPWCNGVTETTLAPTSRDGVTIRRLYGLPAGWYEPIMAPMVE
jgi:hypothetical protein